MTRLDCRWCPGWIKEKQPLLRWLNSFRLTWCLFDERDGFRVAKGKGLRVTGTLGLLDLAADRGMVKFVEAIRALKRTNFRRPMEHVKALLKKHKGRKQ